MKRRCIPDNLASILRERPESLLGTFWQYEKEPADCLVIIEDVGYFPAHKSRLASCSKFFKGAFYGGFKETHKSVLVFPEMDSKALHLCMACCYTGWDNAFYECFKRDALKPYFGDEDCTRIEDKLKIYLRIYEVADYLIITPILDDFLEIFHEFLTVSNFELCPERHLLWLQIIGWGCEKCCPDRTQFIDYKLTRERCRMLIAQMIDMDLSIPFRLFLEDFACLLVCQNRYSNIDMRLEALIEELPEFEPYLNNYYSEWRDLRVRSQTSEDEWHSQSDDEESLSTEELEEEEVENASNSGLAWGSESNNNNNNNSRNS
ncbi:hypothetical protein F5B22DRAFT_656780 [Xylaria bambusicola]|uniref:uncharacterized protein n=1 Tax=Xylaria bambusicola TaxID=326684 RepID=UPI002007645B|nr:uncharacterized protein F5B22DRAFT_656780 [Xylaria bambusicola]KAI0514335.1 hypothetical protein F5B22DRAFT_656780 [Xylaria bambusicola]